MFSQYVHILTLTVLIDTKTHTTTHFLTFLRLIVGVLQRAYLEHVGIVPALFQSRVREDEAHRLRERKQTFFVLHDKVKGTFFVLAFLVFGFYYLAFLVHREISLMNLICSIPGV